MRYAKLVLLFLLVLSSCKEGDDTSVVDNMPPSNTTPSANEKPLLVTGVREKEFVIARNAELEFNLVDSYEVGLDESLAVKLIHPPQSGQLQMDGSLLKYTPSKDFHGEVEIRFTLGAEGYSNSEELTAKISIKPPVLASYEGDRLILHMGPNAHKRLFENVEDSAENFTVSRNGTDRVSVSAFGVTQSYDMPTSIFADGGEGNDTIIAGASKQVRSLGVPVHFIGGKGDDRLWGSNKNDLLEGGVGNDELYGGDGRDRLFGGTGKDKMMGEDGVDIIEYSIHDYQEANEEVISGGLQFDYIQLSGTEGDDHIEYFRFEYTDLNTPSKMWFQYFDADLERFVIFTLPLPPDVDRLIINGKGGEDILEVGDRVLHPVIIIDGDQQYVIDN